MLRRIIAVLAALGVVLTAAGCSTNQDLDLGERLLSEDIAAARSHAAAKNRGEGHTTAPSKAPSRTPRPRADPLPAGSPALASVPTVRRHTAGPSAQDWWRQPRARIVLGAGERRQLRDEAELLAEDLARLPGSTGPVRIADSATAEPRPGDIRLRLGTVAGSAEPAVGHEAYRLRVTRERLTVTGTTDAGVWNGTRTVLGALRARGILPAGTTEDWPDRPQRGLLIDTARKPATAEWLRARIREMGDLKLNQLHLHFSDDQGFRIASARHPEVVSRDHLSKRQVRELIAEAKRRHITVIPEIDSPGHLGQVLRAHPDLALKGAGGRSPVGAIDISDPAARTLLTELIDEYAELFPGPWFHLGGDEYAALLSRNPETAYPKLAAYARQRHGRGATVRDAATGWLNELGAHLRKLGRTPKVWNDGQHRGGRVAPSKDLQVEYWTGKEIGQRRPEEFLGAGRSLMNLNDEYLYYVLGQPNTFRYPDGRRIYQEWNPAVLRGSAAVPTRLASRALVPGARFAVWGDRAGAQTPEQIARGIRDPLRATAQKLWQPDKNTDLSWESFRALAQRALG